MKLNVTAVSSESPPILGDDLGPTTTPASFLISSLMPSNFATPETLIFYPGRENHSHEILTISQTSNDSLSFILVPLLVILSVALFSGMTIYCIQRRNRLDTLRHTLIPLYTYNREDEDWGGLLDDQQRSNRRGRRQFR